MALYTRTGIAPAGSGCGFPNGSHTLFLRVAQTLICASNLLKIHRLKSVLLQDTNAARARIFPAPSRGSARRRAKQGIMGQLASSQKIYSDRFLGGMLPPINNYQSEADGLSMRRQRRGRSG